MTDHGAQEVPADARVARSADIGWEPPDWDAVLRRRRLRERAGAAFLLLIAVVVAPLVRIVLDEPPRVSWNWMGLTVVAVGYAWWAQVTARGREWWEKEVRIGHALRPHVSIGTADRELVTERAETIDIGVPVSLVGLPLLLSLPFVGLVTTTDAPASVRVGIGLVGVLLCAAVVKVTRRRIRRARRWLADPLPRQGSSWT